MTLAEIIAEADALEAQVQSAIDLRMPTLADESIARRDAFRAEHFPLLVAVAEAAVKVNAKASALRITAGEIRRAHRRVRCGDRDEAYLMTAAYVMADVMDALPALDAALRGEGQKP